MPCTGTRRRKTQTLEERNQEVEATLRGLEQQLQASQVTVTIGPQGAVAFNNWQNRNDITDVCAYRTLEIQGSWALRQAVARAEMTQGKRVSLQAVASGYHTHDGGGTWGKH